jgi:hypothetical protein
MTLARPILDTALVLAALPFLLASPAAAGPVTCPASLTVSEKSEAPQGWQAFVPTAPHVLEGITVVNGPKGEEDYSLHPDDETHKGKHLTQVWKLSDYRDRPLHVVCRYQDTDVTLEADLHEDLKTCEITFPWDKNAGVLTDPNDPVRMECR